MAPQLLVPDIAAAFTPTVSQSAPNVHTLYPSSTPSAIMTTAVQPIATMSSSQEPRSLTTVTTSLMYRVDGPQGDFEYTKLGGDGVDTLVYANVRNFETTYIFMSDSHEYTQALAPPTDHTDPQTVVIARTSFGSSVSTDISVTVATAPAATTASETSTLSTAAVSIPSADTVTSPEENGIISGQTDKRSAKCPSADGQLYQADSGCDVFVITCNTDYQNNNIDVTYASDLATCMDLCAPPREDGQLCRAVTFVPPQDGTDQLMGPCYLKDGLNAVSENATTTWAARKVHSCARGSMGLDGRIQVRSDTSGSVDRSSYPSLVSASHSNTDKAGRRSRRSKIHSLIQALILSAKNSPSATDSKHPKNDGSNAWVSCDSHNYKSNTFWLRTLAPFSFESFNDSVRFSNLYVQNTVHGAPASHAVLSPDKERRGQFYYDPLSMSIALWDGKCSFSGLVMGQTESTNRWPPVYIHDAVGTTRMATKVVEGDRLTWFDGSWKTWLACEDHATNEVVLRYSDDVTGHELAAEGCAKVELIVEMA